MTLITVQYEAITIHPNIHIYVDGPTERKKNLLEVKNQEIEWNESGDHWNGIEFVVSSSAWKTPVPCDNNHSFQLFRDGERDARRNSATSIRETGRPYHIPGPPFGWKCCAVLATESADHNH